MNFDQFEQKMQLSLAIRKNRKSQERRQRVSDPALPSSTHPAISNRFVDINTLAQQIYAKVDYSNSVALDVKD